MAALRIALRVLVTLLVVAVAGYVGWRLWDYYTLSPWTRDARVLANVVELAPDVSGLISAINVTDNQKVQKGDVLFVIDQERFKVAVEEAEAVVAQRTQALRLAKDNSRRYASLRAPSIDAVSAQTAERAAIAAEEARAALQEIRGRSRRGTRSISPARRSARRRTASSPISRPASAITPRSAKGCWPSSTAIPSTSTAISWRPSCRRSMTATMPR